MMTVVVDHQHAADVADAIHETSVENLYVLPSGPTPPNPADLLSTPRFGAVLREIWEAIVEMPPEEDTWAPNLTPTNLRGVARERPEVTGPARVRFAPSPTGSLHVGGARTASLRAESRTGSVRPGATSGLPRR